MAISETNRKGVVKYHWNAVVYPLPRHGRTQRLWEARCLDTNHTCRARQSHTAFKRLIADLDSDLTRAVKSDTAFPGYQATNGYRRMMHYAESRLRGYTIRVTENGQNFRVFVTGRICPVNMALPENTEAPFFELIRDE